jgi:hypothetical protein
MTEFCSTFGYLSMNASFLGLNDCFFLKNLIFVGWTTNFMKFEKCFICQNSSLFGINLHLA